MKTQNDFTLIYEDNDIAVLNKKAGLAVAADRYDQNTPRLDLVAEKKLGTLYAVHRIDKDTSGLILYARNTQAQRILSQAFEKRLVRKIYHALVHGHPLQKTFHADMPLVADADVRHRTLVNKKAGKTSVTDFTLLGRCGPFSWLEARPLTGRTHQIRVHSAECGFPIVCDPLYGRTQKPILLSELKKSWRGDPFEERPLLSRLALHAFRLEFVHPKTGKNVIFTASYPKDLEALRKQLVKLYKTDPLAGYEN